MERTYPAKLVISSREFYDTFKASFPEKLDTYDAEETLKQLVDCLSMYGKDMLATMQVGSLPDLNRMKNPKATTDPQLIAIWKAAARTMAFSMIEYLEQTSLFDDQGKFDYLFGNDIEGMLMFDYIPY